MTNPQIMKFFLFLILAFLNFFSTAQSDQSFKEKAELLIKIRLNNPESYKFKSSSVKRTYAKTLMEKDLINALEEKRNLEKKWLARLDYTQNNFEEIKKNNLNKIEFLEKEIYQFKEAIEKESDSILILKVENDSLCSKINSRKNKIFLISSGVSLTGWVLLGISTAGLSAPLVLISSTSGIVSGTLLGKALANNSRKVKRWEEIIEINSNKIKTFEFRIKMKTGYIEESEYNILKIKKEIKKIESEINEMALKINEMALKINEMTSKINEMGEIIRSTPKNLLCEVKVFVVFFAQSMYGGTVKDTYTLYLRPDIKMDQIHLFPSLEKLSNLGFDEWRDDRKGIWE